ncbi:hypothetical protein M0R72_07720 [Candidatus Pacearchaeota archaeon]|jgi:hypothetical protein|nr:hypothetical protein [Candidatus Pacearchaeota archaeon]
MIHIRCVAVLETMWGTEGKAPGMFRINPQNHTGRRLYWLLGHDNLWVTNACPQQVANARQHGKPDSEWLSYNLQRCSYGLLLVCGKVAQATFAQCDYKPSCRILGMPHPAARTWTKAMLLEWQQRIQSGVH